MHIGFIMDGNGRWALRNGLTRADGHQQGIIRANEIMMACVKRKIARATFYAFSVQNWSRDRSEIENIYTAGKALFEEMHSWTKEHNVVVKCVGDKFNLINDLTRQEENPKVKAAIELGRQLMAETATNTGTIITLCVSYGGREEILDVFRRIKEPLESLTTTMVSDFFEIPDVDLVIRTSGEYRISNFLLWQSAFAEYYFTDKMWPEFNELHLDTAIKSYRSRDRRFGGLPTHQIKIEDLKELYEELLASFQPDSHTDSDLHALYKTLQGRTSIRPSKQTAFPDAYKKMSLGSVGSTNILFALYELPDKSKPDAFNLLSRAFTIESLEHVFQKPARLDYIDTTNEEKSLLQSICAMQLQPTLVSRICTVYCGLKLCLKNLIHEDALTFYAILLMFCGDVLDRQFHLPYFHREDLKTIVLQSVRETLELEKHTDQDIRELLTYSCLSVIYHYFEEPNPNLPKSGLEFSVQLLEQLKVLAAERFIEQNEESK